MYYFLANRELIVVEDIDGSREPFTVRLKEDAKSFVKRMNENHKDRTFQFFSSPTEIKLHE